MDAIQKRAKEIHSKIISHPRSEFIKNLFQTKTGEVYDFDNMDPTEPRRAALLNKFYNDVMRNTALGEIKVNPPNTPHKIGYYTNEDNEEFTLIFDNPHWTITGANSTGNYNDDDEIYFSKVLDDEDQEAGYDNIAEDFIDPALEALLGEYRIDPEIGSDGGEYFVEFVMSLGLIKKYFKEKSLEETKNIMSKIDEGGSNTHQITISFNDERLLKRFINNPTLSISIPPSQLRSLKVGDNNLTVNNVTLSKLERFANLGLYTLKGLNEEEGSITTDDENKAEKFIKKGYNVKLSDPSKLENLNPIQKKKLAQKIKEKKGEARHTKLPTITGYQDIFDALYDDYGPQSEIFQDVMILLTDGDWKGAMQVMKYYDIYDDYKHLFHLNENNLPPFMNPNAEDKSFDAEGDMAKRQLAEMMDHIEGLMGMLGNTTQLEAWVQAKITTAAAAISEAYHYIEYEKGNQTDDYNSEHE